MVGTAVDDGPAVLGTAEDDRLAVVGTAEDDAEACCSYEFSDK